MASGTQLLGGGTRPLLQAWHPTQMESDSPGLQAAMTAACIALEAASVAADDARRAAALLNQIVASLQEREAVPLANPVMRAPVKALSPREWDVLALVAEGRSNKAIAQALFVSPNTVKTHVASLLSKLQATSRVQLAMTAHLLAPAGERRGSRHEPASPPMP